MFRIFFTSFILFASFILAGCDFGSNIAKKNINQMPIATFLKSTDFGTSWTPKIKIDEKKTIAGIDVLSIAVNPFDQNNLYLGTAKDGIFVSKDAGENWKKIAFAEKAYGLLFDFRDQNVMYGSGIFNDRAKIYKRIGENEEWKEIYTGPSNGTIISSLVMDPRNNQILYAGTNEGVIIRTNDGGKTWVNLKKAENQTNGPITNIVFDSSNSSHIFFAVFNSGILESKDGGNTIKDISREFSENSQTSNIFSLIADPQIQGVVYAGTDKGIFKKVSDSKWENINIIESSKAFPVRAMVINPKKSNEIIYSSAKAIYKSIDNGKTWSVFQLDTNKEISILKYGQSESGIIYSGLRSF